MKVLSQQQKGEGEKTQLLLNCWFRMFFWPIKAKFVSDHLFRVLILQTCQIWFFKYSVSLTIWERYVRGRDQWLRLHVQQYYQTRPSVHFKCSFQRFREILTLIMIELNVTGEGSSCHQCYFLFLNNRQPMCVIRPSKYNVHVNIVCNDWLGYKNKSTAYCCDLLHLFCTIHISVFCLKSVYNLRWLQEC